MKKFSKKLLALLLVFAMLIPTGALTVITNAEEYGSEMQEWACEGSAYYDSENEYYVLTSNNTWLCGSIWFGSEITSDFMLSFDYYSGDNASGADGIDVIFYNNDTQRGVYSDIVGYSVEIDTFYNTFDPTQSNHISINKSRANHLSTTELTECEDGMWHNLKIIVKNDICSVYVDDDFKVSYNTNITGYGYLGIFGDTGSNRNLHAVKNIEIKTGEDVGENGGLTPSNPGIEKDQCIIIKVEKGGYVTDLSVTFYGNEWVGNITLNVYTIQDVEIPDGEVIPIPVYETLEGIVSDMSIFQFGEFRVEGGENITYTWEWGTWTDDDSEGDVGAEDKNHQWFFDKENTALACSHCDKIYYLSANKNFKFGRDNFSFEHNEVGSYDISFIGNQYVIPALKLDILALGVNLIKRGNNYLENKKDGKGNGTWRGSCYGMACMDASFLSTLSTTDYGSSTVYGLSLDPEFRDSTKLRDSINIMMYSQASILNIVSNWGNNYKAAVSAAKSLSSNSYLPVLTYTGHTVNIIGILPDDFDSKYYVLVTYDCNYPDEPQFILITKEYDKAYLGKINNGEDPIRKTEGVTIHDVKTNSTNNIDFWAPGLSTSPLYSSFRSRTMNSSNVTENYSQDEDLQNVSKDYVRFLLASDEELVVTADDNSYFVYNNEEIIETNIEEIYYEYLSDFGVTKVVIPRTASSYKIESNSQYYANVGYDEKVAVFYCENGGVSIFETDGIASVDTSNTQSYSEMACYKYDMIADSDVVGVMLSNSSSDTKIDFSNNTPFVETSNGEKLNVKIQTNDEELTVKEIALENSDNIENFTLKAENGNIVPDVSCNTHTYSSAVKNEPTCTDKGYTIYTCDCGFTYESDFVDALGHSDANHDGICDACSEDFTKGCSCNCHGNAFMQFLHKIVSFLRKLFGMTQYQYCNCGKAHW